MKTALTLLLASALLVTPGFAQRQAPTQDATRGGSAFRRADINHDGKLTGAELKQVGIDRRQLNAFDTNKDGGIDQAEFAIVVRKRVVAKEQEAKAAARAHAARMAQAAKARAAKVRAANAKGARGVQTKRVQVKQRTKVRG